MIRAEKKVVTLKPSKPEQASTCVGMWQGQIVLLVSLYKYDTTFCVQESGFFVCIKAVIALLGNDS